MRFTSLVAALVTALPLTANAQSVSVGGAIDAPVGQFISFSVGVSGTGVARVNISPSDFSATQSGNDPMQVSNSPFSVSGTAIAAPGSNSFVNVQRQVSPVAAAPVEVNRGDSFNIVNAPGNVNVQIGNPFSNPASGFNFDNGFDFSSNNFANTASDSFFSGGGFFGN
jgi:hypothetical protein